MATLFRALWTSTAHRRALVSLSALPADIPTHPSCVPSQYLFLAIFPSTESLHLPTPPPSLRVRRAPTVMQDPIPLPRGNPLSHQVELLLLLRLPASTTSLLLGDEVALVLRLRGRRVSAREDGEEREKRHTGSLKYIAPPTSAAPSRRPRSIGEGLCRSFQYEGVEKERRVSGCCCWKGEGRAGRCKGGR